MAGIKISELINGGNLRDNDVIPIARGTDTRGIRGSVLATTSQLSSFSLSFKTLSSSNEAAFRQLSSFQQTSFALMSSSQQTGFSTLSASNQVLFRQLSSTEQTNFSRLSSSNQTIFEDLSAKTIRLGKKWTDHRLTFSDVASADQIYFQDYTATLYNNLSSLNRANFNSISAEQETVFEEISARAIQLGKKWTDHISAFGDLTATFVGPISSSAFFPELTSLFITRTPSSDLTWNYQQTPAIFNSSGILTLDDIQLKIITCNSSTAVNLTLPSSTAFDANLIINSSCDFTVINHGTSLGTVTLSPGANVAAPEGPTTSTGSATIPIQTTATFRIRKTSNTDFVVYRIS